MDDVEFVAKLLGDDLASELRSLGSQTPEIADMKQGEILERIHGRIAEISIVILTEARQILVDSNEAALETIKGNVADLDAWLDAVGPIQNNSPLVTDLSREISGRERRKKHMTEINRTLFFVG